MEKTSDEEKLYCDKCGKETETVTYLSEYGRSKYRTDNKEECCDECFKELEEEWNKNAHHSRQD